MRKLFIDSENGYLDLEDLPKNSIFNKVVTGCGGTTIALFNDYNYVVCVPTTELIINKTGLTESGVATIISPNGKNQTVFGLFGKFDYQTKKDLTSYLDLIGIKKIICTYDKLQYLERYLNPSDYKLLVDEYHILLKSYGYRNEAVDGVLKSYKKYQSYCFMSATPISPEFTPEVLKGADLVEAKWRETERLFVKLDQTNNPYVKAANYINAYKRDGYIEVNGYKSKEAFFFLNSVSDIASILGYCNLKRDEVKIVCADNLSNREKLDGYTISNSRSENKKFTFITSKSFEGADYFSDSALVFVISNSRSTNTLLDISTDIYQIAGRIRTATNPFRGLLVHIFNSSGLRDLNWELSFEEMSSRINSEIANANKLISFVNSDNGVKDIAKKIIKNEYILEEDGQYSLNDMIIKLELYTYKIEKQIYSTGIALRKEYNANGIVTTDIEYEKIEECLNKPAKKLSFKDAFLRYSKLVKSFDLTSEKEEIAKVQPLISMAYYKLGPDVVKNLKYNKKAIEYALSNLDKTKSLETKIAINVASQIKLGFISSKDAKALLKDIYETFGYDKPAKATDLTKWFDCKNVVRKIDGKSTKGFEIYSKKIIVKKEEDI